MNALLTFEQMLVMLLMLIVGVVCAKTGVIDADGNRKITRFTLAVPQSCMVLSSAVNIEFEINAAKLAAVFFSGFVMYAVLIALGALVWFALRKKEGERELYAFMTVFGNVGFMGFPVVNALLGGEALLYASLLLVPFNLLAYSVGVMMIRGELRGGFRFDTSVLRSAPMVATYVAVVLLLLRVQVPAPVEQAVDSMGDMIVPLSMIIVGASLGDMPLREALGDWRCYVFSAFRLLAVPAAVWFVMGLFINNELLLGAMTIQAGMPVAAVAAMLSLQYGRNASLASRTVFVSTVLSTLTIPLVCWGLL